MINYLLKIGMQLFGLVATLLGLEVLARLFYNRLTPLLGRRAVTVLSGQTTGDEVTAFRYIRHPYMLYVNRPGWTDQGFVQNNSLGYRGAEISPLPEPGVVRILALGDSTTYGFGIHNPADAWPAQLERLLAQQFGPGVVEVINGGLCNATTAENLAHYMFRDRYLKANLVVVHVPGNDIRAQGLNDYHPEYTHFRRGYIAPVLTPRQGERTLLRSGLVKVGYAWWLWRTLFTDKIWDETDWRLLPAEQVLHNVTTNASEGFRRNLDLLIRTIIQDGAQPVIMPFVLGNAEVSIPSLQALYPANVEAIGLNNRLAEEIAHQYQTPFFSLSAEAIPADGYLDHCHLSPMGDAIKARFLCEKLQPLIQQQLGRL